MNPQKITLIIVLCVWILGIILLKSLSFPFERITLPEKMALDKLPFLVIVSTVISYLLTIVFTKKTSVWILLYFVGFFSIVFPINLIFISYYDYAKIDFLLSEKSINFKEIKEEDDAWKIRKFIIKKDTIYKTDNINWSEIYDGDYTLSKSRFQEYYYVTKVEK